MQEDLRLSKMRYHERKNQVLSVLLQVNAYFLLNFGLSLALLAPLYVIAKRFFVYKGAGLPYMPKYITCDSESTTIKPLRGVRSTIDSTITTGKLESLTSYFQGPLPYSSLILSPFQMSSTINIQKFIKCSDRTKNINSSL